MTELQETRYAGQSSIAAAGYTAFFRGSEKGGKHGVDIAVRAAIVKERGFTPEFVSERSMKIMTQLSGNFNAGTCVMVYTPTKVATEPVKSKSWTVLHNTAAQIPAKTKFSSCWTPMPVLQERRRDCGRSVIGACGATCRTRTVESCPQLRTTQKYVIIIICFNTPKGGSVTHV